MAKTFPFLVCYLLIHFLFSMSTWGTLGEGDGTIYGRGSGQLFFPIVTWCLWGMFLVTVVGSRFRGITSFTNNLTKYFWLFNLLFVIHILFSVAFDVPLRDTLGHYGIILIFNMSLLFFVLLLVVRKPAQLDVLISAFLMCALVRGVYGLIRFVFFGGDDANPYRNYQLIDVNLTFFDINDSLVAGMAAFIAAWNLMHPAQNKKVLLKLFHWAVLLVGIGVIIFSYRRTSWLGLVAMSALLLFLMPARKQPWAWLTVAPITALAIVVVSARRFSDMPISSIGDLFEMFVHDFVAEGNAYRLDEIIYATDTIRDNLFFGVGAWGHYIGSYIPWQTGEHAYQFVHSGILHLLLKTGLLGTSIFVALIVAYVVFLLKKRTQVPPERAGIFYAGGAGLLFLLPTLLVGTPFIEWRTTQLMGLVLALPYLVVAANRSIPTSHGSSARVLRRLTSISWRRAYEPPHS